MRYLAALVLALLLNASANLMMKVGAKHLDSPGPRLELGLSSIRGAIAHNWVLVLGLFCFATNVLFYTYALKRIPISLAYPIMVGAGFAIIAVVAWRYLGETLSVVQWAGITLILLGIVLVAREMRPVAGD
ncbi:MAG: EamA family transporter [Planctomycetes bacterium]|nr:EamA family transporter [Planctomycetota bacterium]